jgi:hypothetical protein
MFAMCFVGTNTEDIIYPRTGITTEVIEVALLQRSIEAVDSFESRQI